jgi:hypothetical protein
MIAPASASIETSIASVNVVLPGVIFTGAGGSARKGIEANIPKISQLENHFQSPISRRYEARVAKSSQTPFALKE